MKKDKAEKWVQALRSGEFVQGHGALCRDGRYCCLGVLAELAVREGVLGKYDTENRHGSVFTRFGSDGERSFLPREVFEWADLSSDNPIIDSTDSLASLNDNGVPFEMIADIIEEKWGTL